MPLLGKDKDITQGWVRERTLLKRLYEQTVMSKSPLFRKYVEGIAKTTGVPEERVVKSRPVRNFLRRIAGV